MNTTIITGIFAITVAIISGFFTTYSRKQNQKRITLKNNIDTLKKNLSEAYSQIESFFTLEDYYANHLFISCNDKRKPKKIKEDFRTLIVKNENCDRPYMTANTARKLKKLIS